MKGKAVFVIMVAVSASLLVSGCTGFLRRAADRVGGGECMELEEKLGDQTTMDCKCYPTGFIPDDIANRTSMDEYEGKCYCLCSPADSDEEVNISIVEGPDGETIVTRFS